VDQALQYTWFVVLLCATEVAQKFGDTKFQRIIPKMLSSAEKLNLDECHTLFQAENEWIVSENAWKELQQMKDRDAQVESYSYLLTRVG
jgi:hypothetical protein